VKAAVNAILDTLVAGEAVRVSGVRPTLLLGSGAGFVVSAAVSSGAANGG